MYWIQEGMQGMCQITQDGTKRIPQDNTNFFHGCNISCSNSQNKQKEDNNNLTDYWDLSQALTKAISFCCNTSENQEQVEANHTAQYQYSPHLTQDVLSRQPKVYEVQWHCHLDLNEQTPTHCYIIVWCVEQEEASKKRTEIRWNQNTWMNWKKCNWKKKKNMTSTTSILDEWS